MLDGRVVLAHASISNSNIAIGIALLSLVAQLLRDIEALLMVLDGLFELAQVAVDISKKAVGASLSSRIVQLLCNIEAFLETLDGLFVPLRLFIGKPKVEVGISPAALSPSCSAASRACFASSMAVLC